MAKPEPPVIGADTNAIDGAVYWGASLVLTLARRWRRALVYTAIGCIGAVAVSLALPNEYTSTAAFIARTSTNLNLPSGLLGAAASLGLDRGGDYSPKFYTDLLGSRPVLQSAVEHLYPASPGDSLNSVSYVALAGFASQSHERGVNNAIKHLALHVSASEDVRSNLITLSVRSRRPDLSQAIAVQLLEALDSLNVTFRQNQSRDLREFYESQVQETRHELDSAEAAVRSFMQSNRVANSPSLQFELQRLQRSADLKQTLYATVMQQYEQARLQEARAVPTLTVLAPPFKPVDKSYPPRRLIVALGVMGGLVALLLQVRLGDAWEEWRRVRTGPALSLAQTRSPQSGT